MYSVTVHKETEADLRNIFFLLLNLSLSENAHQCVFVAHVILLRLVLLFFLWEAETPSFELNLRMSQWVVHIHNLLQATLFVITPLHLSVNTSTPSFKLLLKYEKQQKVESEHLFFSFSAINQTLFFKITHCRRKL